MGRSEYNVKCIMLVIPDNVIFMFPSPLNVEFSSLLGKLLATFMEIFPVADMDLVARMPPFENCEREE